MGGVECKEGERVHDALIIFARSILSAVFAFASTSHQERAMRQPPASLTSPYRSQRHSKRIPVLRLLRQLLYHYNVVLSSSSVAMLVDDARGRRHVQLESTCALLPATGYDSVQSTPLTEY